MGWGRSVRVLVRKIKNAAVIRNACVQSIEVQCVNFNHADGQSMVFFLNFEHEAFLLVQL